MKYELPNEIKDRVSKYYNFDSKSDFIFDTTNIFNIENISINTNMIMNLARINNIRRINKFHEQVNSRLDIGGIYLSCAETLNERHERNYKKILWGFKNIFLLIDFIYKRVIPKIPVFKQIYFLLTKGHNRVMSKTEILGRIISCGFKIEEYFEYNNLLYIISRKKTEPIFDMDASYGMLFKMRRIGHLGKVIGVYKIRTMYPYSEYCQELATTENKLDPSGKVKDDFRVTSWGKFLRRFWIDELPMLINFFKRELNIVGVRPLSKDYFQKYPKELQDERVKFKPGLIPPYYADMPNNFEEILESERVYLKSKLKSPIITDIRYFFRALVNIIIKGARSN